ncbi:MAG: chemotaxis protein CheW [Bryobacterales bacterium]|nr:chemotaxis protein CheW [Bryobacterales bacterium]
MSGEPESQAALASTFYVKGVLCALDATSIQEVVRVRPVTRVAHAPEYVLGVTNLRGRIITVIDLARRLNLGIADVTPESRMYIVRDGDEAVGLLVDRASDVVDLPSHELNAGSAGLPAGNSRYIAGIGRFERQVVLQLNPAGILEA